jgi:hypothetical protein
MYLHKLIHHPHKVLDNPFLVYYWTVKSWIRRIAKALPKRVCAMDLHVLLKCGAGRFRRTVHPEADPELDLALPAIPSINDG